MHNDAYHFVARAVLTHGACGPVLEIGSRNINGSIRPLFGAMPYIGIDLYPGPDVDIVGDAMDYSPIDPPNTVICCEVLEHTRLAIDLVEHACLILNADGLIILTTADRQRAPHSAIDGGPLRPGEYYGNLVLEELIATLKGCSVQVLQAESNGQDLYLAGRKRIT